LPKKEDSLYAAAGVTDFGKSGFAGRKQDALASFSVFRNTNSF
jgi:hypothetical protein